MHPLAQTCTHTQVQVFLRVSIRSPRVRQTSRVMQVTHPFPVSQKKKRIHYKLIVNKKEIEWVTIFVRTRGRSFAGNRGTKISLATPRTITTLWEKESDIDYNSVIYICFLKVLSRKTVDCLDSFSRSSDITAVGRVGLGRVGQYLAPKKWVSINYTYSRISYTQMHHKHSDTTPCVF